MSNHKKPTPIEAFELNMADADRLVVLADSFTNARARRMRKELREKVGTALKFTASQRELLDCAESDDVFIVLKPGGRLARKNFDQHEPLLRQAIVAGCSATETYLADRAIAEIRELVGRGITTDRMKKISMSYEQWLAVDGYVHPKRGITEKVLAPHIREFASTAPSPTGELLSLVGLDKWSTKVDTHRSVSRGTTVKELERITQRRNKVAHEGDRRGYSRAKITVAEVQADLLALKSIVEAIEALL